jgi:hypothetical protein
VLDSTLEDNSSIKDLNNDLQRKIIEYEKSKNVEDQISSLLKKNELNEK